MSLHKARPEDDAVNPLRPKSTAMVAGRIARPHDEVLGGIQHAAVDGVSRTPEEEKEKVHAYHQEREQVKKVAKETFDPKTGKPVDVAGVNFQPNPQADAQAAPNDGGQASPEEVKKNVEAEKKVMVDAEKKKEDTKK
jgi:hypothetical protein